MSDNSHLLSRGGGWRITTSSWLAWPTEGAHIFLKKKKAKNKNLKKRKKEEKETGEREKTNY